MAGILCSDRLKMIKHKAGANTVVAPKSVEPITMKGQMKPTFRVSQQHLRQEETIKAMSKPYNCIQYSNRLDLQKKSLKQNSTVGTHHWICKAVDWVELEQHVSKFKISNLESSKLSCYLLQTWLFQSLDMDTALQYLQSYLSLCCSTRTIKSDHSNKVSALRKEQLWCIASAMQRLLT